MGGRHVGKAGKPYTRPDVPTDELELDLLIQEAGRCTGRGEFAEPYRTLDASRSQDRRPDSNVRALRWGPGGFGSRRRAMVHMTVKLLDSGERRDYYGTENEMCTKLRLLFPRETEQHARLMSCIEAVNAEGFAEVDIEPYRQMARPLPEGYATQDQSEDPWVREADRE